MAGRPSGGRSPKRRRLSRSAEFERVYRQGRSKANRYLVLYAFPREDDAPAGASPAAGAEDAGTPPRHAEDAGTPPRHADAASTGISSPPAPEGASAPGMSRAPDGPRLGLSVSKRVGGAVDRTKVKRVLREAFWAEAERLPAGSDYVVVARPDSRELAEREGMPGVRTALAELVDAMGGTAREESRS